MLTTSPRAGRSGVAPTGPAKASDRAGVDADRRRLLAAGGAALALAHSPAMAGSASGKPSVADGEVFDVIVVGGGSAGCVAALFAHDAAARVLLLEKASIVGGTSAKSGGGCWIPNNAYMRAKGVADRREDFLRYVVRSSYPGGYDPVHPTLGAPASVFRLMEAFYDNAAVAIERLDRMGALRCEPMGLPDYHEEFPQDRAPLGRTLAVSRRFADGPNGGDEMIAQLLAALVARDVDIRTGHRVSALDRNQQGEIVGVTARDANGREHRLLARRGVVFATGGFTHNGEMLARYSNVPVFGGCAAPISTGDFVAMAVEVGAQFGNMGCAWRAPVVLDDTVKYVSAPVDVFGVLADSMVTVNRFGRRCGNERRTYPDRAMAMYRYDDVSKDYPDLIQFVIYDRRAAELFAGMMPLPPTPTGIDYVIEGADLAELAAKIDARLAALGNGTRLAADFAVQLGGTIARFNGFAETGEDVDFRRGAAAFDRWFIPTLPEIPRWRKNGKPNPTMYPLSDTGPFYAIITAPGVLDTNGGPVIDAKARVLDAGDAPIPGLFGAGNCIASPARDSYWSGGTTIALAITFGMIAGTSAAAERPRALA